VDIARAALAQRAIAVVDGHLRHGPEQEFFIMLDAPYNERRALFGCFISERIAGE